MYPVLAVFTAVSTRPSLPPRAWAKNSSGVSPVMKLLRTLPPSIGAPSTYCWPTHVEIWTMFTMLPLAPESTMVLKQLSGSMCSSTSWAAAWNPSGVFSSP